MRVEGARGEVVREAAAYTDRQQEHQTAERHRVLRCAGEERATAVCGVRALTD